MEYAAPKSIKNWAEEDRPREKLLLKGIGSLTEAELIAILIGSGNSTMSAVELSRYMIDRFGGLQNMARLSVQELTTIKGIGEAKAISILAAFELAKRKQLAEYKDEVITGSQSAANYLRPRMEDLPHEVFYVLFLNRKNKIIAEKQLFSGGVSQTVIDPRIALKEAINHLACGMIISHNHPSGNLKPSDADLLITRKLYEGCKFIDVKLVDHLIITDRGHFSFAENGLLNYEQGK